MNLEPSLPRRAYVDEAFHALERDRIFLSEWVYAGRAERLRDAGEYELIDVAGESVILVRAGSGDLRAFYNLCRHRGSALLADRCGSVRGAIACPYHGWTYDLDGRLIGAPFLDAGVDRSALGLHAVSVAEWEGFVFLNLSPERTAPSLAEHLRPVPERLARYPLAELRIARTIRYDVAANWKVLLENYNECYHCAVVHPELCRIVPEFRKQGGAGLDWDRGIPHRDGAFTFTATGTTGRAPFATLDADERVRHKGELIYPNFMLSLAAEHVAAFCVLPRGAGRTEVVCDFLFHPDEMEKASFEPSDAVDFWDLVNRQDWAISEALQRGMSSRRFRFGWYAPMETPSLDIRRYVARRLGEDAVALGSEQ